MMKDTSKAMTASQRYEEWMKKMNSASLMPTTNEGEEHRKNACREAREKALKMVNGEEGNRKENNSSWMIKISTERSSGNCKHDE